MIAKDNVLIGLETRFGPKWPGQRCGAKTRRGTACQRPANKRNGRCRLHGGASYGGGATPLWAVEGIEAQLTLRLPEYPSGYIRGVCVAIDASKKQINFESKSIRGGQHDNKANYHLTLSLSDIGRYDTNHISR